jgi:hypothetical protein
MFAKWEAKSQSKPCKHVPAVISLTADRYVLVEKPTAEIIQTYTLDAQRWNEIGLKFADSRIQCCELWQPQHCSILLLLTELRLPFHNR